MPYKLLVTDDNTHIIEVLQRRLKREGFEVVTAGDGEEALLKIESDEPDVILLDLRMPKMNGFEVLKEIKRRNEIELNKIRPVIIISGGDESEAKEEGLILSETECYLNKPCSIEEILKAIRKMIGLLNNVKPL
ncbi:MAG: response regulator [Candidatus Omnitrophota bacterium]|jgi:DNA-binding response OmpR family regulator